MMRPQFRSRRRRRCAELAAAALVAAAVCGSRLERAPAADVGGEPPAATVQELERRLAVPVDVAWSGAALREVLTSRGRLSGIAVVLDRRVDPGLAVELQAARRPAALVLREVAAAHGLGLTTLGPVVYVGPRETAADLRTIVALRQQETQMLPPDLRMATARKTPASWTDLAEPRTLLERFAGEAHLTITNPEAVPHDLWPAANLPPLSSVERLTLVAAQFGLTFRIDGNKRTLTLAPSDAAPRVVRTYTPGGDVEAAVALWRRNAPEAEIVRQGATVRVTGRIEDHERLRGGSNAAGPAAPPAPPVAAAGDPTVEKRYTLRLKNKSFGALVALLRDTHKLPIEVDDAAVRAAGISLDTLTSVEVAEATLEELLRQAGAPLGLGVRRVDGKLRIGPVDK